MLQNYRQMMALPETLFRNPIWYALNGPHRHLAITDGAACRYPADVAPFAAIAEQSAEAPPQSFLASSESVWVAGGQQWAAVFQIEEEIDCLQMALSPQARLPPMSADIVALGQDDAQEMMALTDVAFPGFFRPATYKMGSWSRLIAVLEYCRGCTSAQRM